jgi:hypothetical protein
MIFPEGEPAPNLVARNISLRFPVRLNLDARVREYVGVSWPRKKAYQLPISSSESPYTSAVSQLVQPAS